ncbi:hypothetical protein A9G37_06185 [Gilliamella sp. GillExp13]|nr:hypothetical protein A9G37_06185 [Gilliamella apicola]
MQFNGIISTYFILYKYIDVKGNLNNKKAKFYISMAHIFKQKISVADPIFVKIFRILYRLEIKK